MITEAAKRYGSQCIVVAIDAKGAANIGTFTLTAGGSKLTKKRSLGERS